MRTRIRIHIVATVIALTTVSLPAATGRLTLGMVLPANTMWHKVVTEMADDWRSTTDGRVAVRVQSGAGEEATILQKMRNDVFQVGALSVIGLTDIDQAFEVFTIPMFFESYGELYKVAEALTPLMKERLEKKGFVLRGWGHGGWVHLFSRQPIRDVADLKRQKLFAWAGDDAGVQTWRARGYQPVPLAATDVAMGFQTGMIDVVPTTPIAALSLQWFRQTPYMQGLGMVPLVGGVVVRPSAPACLFPAPYSLRRRRLSCRLAASAHSAPRSCWLSACSSRALWPSATLASVIQGLGLRAGSVSAQFHAGDAEARHRPHSAHGHTLRVSENQLAQVLDYAGVAVWDWSRSGNHQTASFGAVMGADGDGAFTPEAFVEFVHGEDRSRFEEKVFGSAEGDGGYDETIRLHRRSITGRLRERFSFSLAPCRSLRFVQRCKLGRLSVLHSQAVTLLSWSIGAICGYWAISWCSKSRTWRSKILQHLSPINHMTRCQLPRIVGRNIGSEGRFPSSPLPQAKARIPRCLIMFTSNNIRRQG